MDQVTIALPVATPADVPLARLHGTVLSYLPAGGYAAAVESALSRRGMTILRAYGDLHALSMARCGKPDLVLIAIDQPAAQTHSFLEELRRSRFGASVRVVAFVPKLQQDTVGQTCLRFVSTTIVIGSPLELVVAEIAQLLSLVDRTFRRDDAATASIDAVFSELGTRERRRRRVGDQTSISESRSPIGRMPTRIRRVDQQPHFTAALSEVPSVDFSKVMRATSASF